MTEGLMTSDGKPVDSEPVGSEDQDFAQMMVGAAKAADSDAAKEAPAPPKKSAEAPYGYKPDGTPKKAAGRPRKDRASQPRVQAPKKTEAKKDYTEELTGLVQTLWMATAAFAPADAGAIQVHGSNVVKAWNDLAQENSQVAKGIEFLTTGSMYGAVVATTAPLVMQLLVNHNVLPHERLAPLGVQSPEALAGLTEQTVAGMASQAA
ncbi:hypothetical protein [Actinomadura violacea]|uniref:Uncharacterized protein n=1 Tax=Actinomadura violacea TaxID=2819934 RepID=A0ABS3RW49_9ACTN|nr:hypothetical protein [Actinomadura violacea]MBO2460980.1 hypothetical protein [Actinomadura violacea]